MTGTHWARKGAELIFSRSTGADGTKTALSAAAYMAAGVCGAGRSLQPGRSCGNAAPAAGIQYAGMAAAIIRGQKPGQVPIKALQHKILYLNLKAAAAQNISFSADIVAKAEKVIR